MVESDLSWRIEAVCLMAWPALRETPYNNWLMRFSNGLSRRINSVNPLGPQTGDIDDLIEICTMQYRNEALPVYFRIPSIIDPSAEKHLRRRGFTAEGESLVLYSDIENVDSGTDEEAGLLQHPNAEWLESISRAKNHTGPEGEIYRRIVKSITLPAGYAMLRAEGRVVSLAFGVIHDELLCFESVITAAPFRGRGYARRLITSLTAWAKTAGAKGVCLQVEADNKPAVALYNGLGLKELYRYHYEREPISS